MPALKTTFSLAEGISAVPIEVALGRPEILHRRAEDPTVGEGEHVAGHVLVGPHAPGDQDLVFLSHAHEAFVEGPVTEAAERKAVRRTVVMSFAPGFDVGGLHHRMALRGDHPDSAEGTAVIVEGDDRFPETLIPDPSGLLRSLCFLPWNGRLLNAGQKFFAVFVGDDIHASLFQQPGTDLGGKVSVDQSASEDFPA